MLANRVDAFSMLAVAAWEQLLKAKLVEEKGEDTIFVSGATPRRTLGVKDCLELLVLSGAIRRNLDQVIELRNAAIHLVCPELQAPLSPVFQACVLNFAKEYVSLSGDPLLPATSAGLLCLVGDESPLDAVVLAGAHGPNVSKEILQYAERLREDVAGSTDPGYAVRLRLRFAKPNEQGGFLSVLGEGGVGMTVVHKHVDRTKDWFRSRQVVDTVRSRMPAFNTHDFEAIAFKQGWKATDSNFHVLQRNPDTHKYSPEAIDEVSRLAADSEWMKNARASLAADRKKNALRRKSERLGTGP